MLTTLFGYAELVEIVGADEEAAEILELMNVAHELEQANSGEGRRERKKRQQRQTISNVATALFLAHGFDNVTVSQIAEGCDVSEQTIFNYFPTKESMFFDRTEDATEALADLIRVSEQTLSVAIADLLSEGPPLTQWRDLDEDRALDLFRRFCAAIGASPALSSARYGDVPNLVSVIADALADRSGIDLNHPDVQVGALVVLGLVHARTHSTIHHVVRVTTFAELEASVRDDVLAAAALVDPVLRHFDRDIVSNPDDNDE